MASLRRLPWRSFARRVAVAGALLAYLAAAVGLPLPPQVVVKDGGKPFPCQGHLCGCQTAEECWRHCCCYTAAERWAWARANGVQPPDYAEKPSDDDRRVACDDDHDSCPHCHGSAPASACRHAASHRPPLWGLALAPLSCRGETTQWVLTGVMPAPAPVRVGRSEPALSDRLDWATVEPFRVLQAPPFPPPRIPSV